MKAVIFANGLFRATARIDTICESADLIIAADGGADHCAALDIIPDILIGDCDSIAGELLAAYRSKGVIIEKYPPRKNADDLELALDYAVEKGASEINILGALGGRWDMSFANVLMMTQKQYQGIAISFINHECEISLLKPGKVHTLSGYKGKTVSFLPLPGDQASGVHLSGFEYPLTDETIVSGSTLGVSNIVVSNTASIKLADGALLCFVLL